MEQNRTKRDLETRATTLRPTKWRPAELLPNANPETGYAYRWLRFSTLNQDDPRNIAAKLAEGWEPVKASDHPEIQLFGKSAHSDFSDSICVGGLMLCKTPAEFIDQRAEHYGSQSSALMQSVDNSFMRASDPRMPLFKERKTSVTFGRN